MNDDTLLIGTRENWTQRTTFGIQAPELRHHVYVIGKTGSGKTTLLRNLILQHIAQGHGVGLIDPHGDLAEDLVHHIPFWRTKHLVYFNPSDLEFPIGLNPLNDVSPDDRHLIASGMVAAFKSIWRDSFGPRMEYIFYNAIAALLDCSNTSLLGLNRLMTDDTYRAWVIRQIKDPFIRDFWQNEYAGYDSRFRREAIAPIQNKVGQFLLNPVIRNILGQVRRKVSFPFMMDNRRIFIANLSKGKLGPDKANLLGSFLVMQFQLAAMARTAQPEHERVDFHLFVDEFHNFTTDAFASLLAEARKYRLCLTLSHQYIDQLSLPIRQAIFGNIGTMISFRVGHGDASVLKDEFSNELAAQHFVDLNRFEILIRLLQDGNDTTPFRGMTLAPLENSGVDAADLISHGRMRFAKPRESVERELNRWLADASVTPDSNTNRRRRQSPRSGTLSFDSKLNSESAKKKIR